MCGIAKWMADARCCQDVYDKDGEQRGGEGGRGALEVRMGHGHGCDHG